MWSTPAGEERGATQDDEVPAAPKKTVVPPLVSVVPRTSHVPWYEPAVSAGGVSGLSDVMPSWAKNASAPPVLSRAVLLTIGLRCYP